MQLLNVPAPEGVWAQVHDGSMIATIGISPGYAYVCQSATQPAPGLIGFPLINREVEVISYVATVGDPVWVKALGYDLTAIINA